MNVQSIRSTISWGILCKNPRFISRKSAGKGQKKNRRPEGRRRVGKSRLGRRLAEEREDRARLLVGDRQRLDAELLLGLQRLEVGALLGEVGIDQGRHAGLEGRGQLLHEVAL